MTRSPMPPKAVLARLRKGTVIPAHPLALDSRRKLDERRQRALTRYYVAAGVGGVAVGVHTTQFAIHEPKVGLLRPVLELAAETVKASKPRPSAPVILVAGLCGSTRQAVHEARLAADVGYHAGLLNLGSLRQASVSRLISHVKAVAEVIPVFGFHLQPSLGGRKLDFDFWQRCVEIDNLVAIKIAAFNRYQTLDVIRAVVEAERERNIALYTGNDDNILMDLLTPFRFSQDRKSKTVRIVGGLLGQWALWTRRAVLQLAECHRVIDEQRLPIPQPLATLAAQVTDVNSALFDAAHSFRGAIPGIHEVMRRQGLLAGRWCLNPRQTLSPGQMRQIDRVYAAYPHLNDDAFVAANLDSWLR